MNLISQTPAARRRSFFRTLSTRLLWLVGSSLALSLPTQTIAAEQGGNPPPKVLRIGLQKSGPLLILKTQGQLEKRLAAQGVAVKWVEFPYGPPLLEAINVGSIDVGTVGESPPVFAQAAGANLVYIGNEPPSPASEALIVPKHSPIRRVAELKGKKVAVAKGSNAHYLLVKRLEQAGLKLTDIQPIYLPPADARAAFESGRVDAWVIWDPFLAAAEQHLNARQLADGQGAVQNHQFYLAARPFAERHPEIIQTLLEEIRRTGEWADKNPQEAARLLAPQLGIEQALLETAEHRRPHGVRPTTPAILQQQQQVADTFYGLKLIPKPVKVADWGWEGRK